MRPLPDQTIVWSGVLRLRAPMPHLEHEIVFRPAIDPHRLCHHRRLKKYAVSAAKSARPENIWRKQ